MIGGYNHNVIYRGTAFHVQTEDSGPKRPQLVTLLYHGGTIIASRKTLYDDIIKVDNLKQVLEDLAKEQHKGMLRRLTRGEFDQKIATLGIDLAPPAPAQPDAERPAEGGADFRREPLAGPAPTPATPDARPVYSGEAGEEAAASPPAMTELDRLIYAYLTAGQTAPHA